MSTNYLYPHKCTVTSVASFSGFFFFFFPLAMKILTREGSKNVLDFCGLYIKIYCIYHDLKLDGFTNHVTSFQGFSCTCVNRPIIDHLLMIEQLFISSSYVLHFECYVAWGTPNLKCSIK